VFSGIFEDVKSDHSSHSDSHHHHHHHHQQQQQQVRQQHEAVDTKPQDAETRTKTDKELWSPGRELEQLHHTQSTGTASVVTVQP